MATIFTRNEVPSKFQIQKETKQTTTTITEKKQEKNKYKQKQNKTIVMARKMYHSNHHLL